jgi:hypothetical protein
VTFALYGAAVRHDAREQDRELTTRDRGHAGGA